jgi:UDP-N-acetylglucosamine acyltransferase
MIHPTAIIDSRAEIGSGTEIGPYVVIEGPVVIGPDNEIQAHAILTGELRIGTKNFIGYGSVIGGLPQDLAFDRKSSTRTELGDSNVIREHCTIHRGTKPGTATTVGSHNLLMVGAHLGHNTQLGNHVIVANNVLLGGYVEVGDRAFLGGSAVFHQYIRVGPISMVSGAAAVSRDIPPYSIAVGMNSVVGINTVGLRRAGFGSALRTEVKKAHELLYHSGLKMTEAVDRALQTSWSPPVQEFWNFVRSSRRGICAFARFSDIKEESITSSDELNLGTLS